MKNNVGSKKLKEGNAKGVLKTLASGIAVVIILVALVGINKDKVKTVDVVKTTSDIYTNNLILLTSIEKYPMSKLEYDTSINKYLLWSDNAESIDKYATTFTKKGAYIYKGDYRDTKPTKNEWLQEVPDGSLVVSLPYNKGNNFGNILTPGDTLKVNVTYIEESADRSGYGAAQTTVRKTLYGKAKVIDLLNSSGNSIYDYYMDLLAMSISEREKYLRDEKFLSNVSPNRILFEINGEAGFDDYSAILGKSSLVYTYGLYPRRTGDIILDQFSDLARQIGSEINSLATEGGAK